MAHLTIENLSFAYASAPERKVLDNVNLQVQQGEYIALCGRSGSGKTTLLRHLKTALTPHGIKSGRILLDGTPLDEVAAAEQSAAIGYVMQDPDAQIVTDKVWHELAFGLENLGVEEHTMRLRVAEMASYFGIQDWFHRDIAQLSGGQKQLLNLAAIMALQPQVLILDEPTSQLDPIAAADFLNTVRKINRELGTTVIITEHRLEDIFHAADRCVVMEHGRIIADSDPHTVGAQLQQQRSDMFAALPSPVRIFYGAGFHGTDCPLTVREGRSWLSRQAENRTFAADLPQEPTVAAPAALEMKNVWFRYEKEGNDILCGVNLTVAQGSFHAILGGNGTGKSTTLNSICGICRPYRGKVLLHGSDIRKEKDLFRGKLAMLPQDPRNLFVKDTVRADLMEMLPGDDAAEEKIKRMAQICCLEGLLDQHPYDLSGGEQQRAALAKVLLTEPKLLLLDEPTKGLDNFFKEQLGDVFRCLLESGVTILMVSHDVEFCARNAHAVSMFFDGQVLTTTTPRRFFAQNSFYTTAANRMARHIFPQAVTVEDVVHLMGGGAQ